MDNFFDDLKNNLENRPQPEFEESAWSAMQEKMQSEEKKSSKSFAGWWWMSLLAIPLFISNGWMYIQMEKAEALLEKIEILRDTVLKTQIIYKTDTIYKTQIIHESFATKTLTPSNASQNKTIHLPKINFNKYIFNQPFVFGKTINPDNYLFQNTPLLASRNSNLDTRIQNNQPSKNDNFSSTQKEIIDLIKLPSLKSKKLSKDIEAIQLIDIQQLAKVKTTSQWKKRMQTLSYTLSPKGFHLGLGGGLAYPLNENLKQRDGESISLKGAVAFSKNLRLWMDVSYLLLHLKADDLQDDNYGIPSIPLPNDDYTFDEASADQPLYQFGVGMQYVFNTKKRWRPYLGLGYSSIALQPYEVEYEFEDLLGEEIIVQRDYSTKGLINNLWIANAGLEYHFGKNWYGQFEGYYRASWKKEGNLTPNILGSNVRLVYKF